MTAVAPTPERWSLVNRVLFRFAFVYLVLYCWPSAGRPSILDAIPNFALGAMNEDDASKLTNYAEAPWHALCPWVAVHVFHLRGEVTQYHPTGSGDTTLDYVFAFCSAVIAGLVTPVWSMLDRRRPNYQTLYAHLRLLVRFTLAFTMLSYGFAKLYPLQFVPPFMTTLTETYGESSPMGILWTFMGASAAYTRFCGMAEVTAGLLLLFRRTTVVGALVATGAMLNVAALNFCYDVPVKLYSVHLVLMSIFLLIPESMALMRFFFTRQAAELERASLPRFERRWLRIAAVVLQVCVITSVLYNNIWGGYKSVKEANHTYFKHAPLFGVWNADTFTAEGPDSARWRELAIQMPGWLFLRNSAGERIFFQTTYDEAKHTLTLNSRQTKQQANFTYRQPDAQHLALSGTLNGKPAAAEFHRVVGQFLLTTRGFHWISEYPFNR
ncbi:MAG: hypothetical protein ACLP59_21105 [Bryobacteraceae bacterium]